MRRVITADIARPVTRTPDPVLEAIRFTRSRKK